jgi:hypothetical protein
MFKGTVISRLLFGVVFMIYPSIIIQQQLGLIEMHFLYFCMLAFLAMYKDIIQLLSAAVAAVIYHVLFTYLQLNGVEIMGTPALIYSGACNWGITLLHVLLVVVELVGLFVIIIGNTHQFLSNKKLESESFENMQKLKEETLKKYSSSLGIQQTREGFQKYYDKVYESVKTRFKSNKNVIIHRMDSKKWFDYIDIKFDWIYVDGDHSYEGCLIDLENCLKVLKKNGIIFGDDYGNKPGVVKAVDEFITKHNFKLEVFAHNQFQINI